MIKESYASQYKSKPFFSWSILRWDNGFMAGFNEKALYMQPIISMKIKIEDFKNSKFPA